MNRVAAAVVIYKENRFLLVQEKDPTQYGLWDWPGGKCEKDETVEACAVREAREEACCSVRIIKEIGEWPTKNGNLRVLFLAELVTDPIGKSSEVLDAKWFTKAGIIQMKDQLRKSWVIEGIEKL